MVIPNDIEVTGGHVCYGMRQRRHTNKGASKDQFIDKEGILLEINLRKTWLILS